MKSAFLRPLETYLKQNEKPYIRVQSYNETFHVVPNTINVVEKKHNTQFNVALNAICLSNGTEIQVGVITFLRK